MMERVFSPWWCQCAGMTIRVDKCVTFRMRKGSTKFTQFQPKLIVNSELVPPILNDDSFRYLGRYFDFEMSNRKHKSELSEILRSLMSDIDKLPMHLKTSYIFIKGMSSQNIVAFDSSKYL